MRLRAEEEQTVAETTDGFSFAYLKELFVASMVRWMADKKAGDMPRLLTEQQVVLREHLRAESVHEPPKPAEASALETMMKRFL
jgi:hypothetical protein